MVSEQVQALCKNIIDEVGKVFVADNDVILRKYFAAFLREDTYFLRTIPDLEKPCL